MTTQRPPRSAAEQERLDTAYRELFERMIAFNQLLGMKVESLDPAGARIRFEMRPNLIGHYPTGRLHGGVIASVLDATGGLALMCAIAEKHRDETAAQVMSRPCEIQIACANATDGRRNANCERRQGRAVADGSQPSRRSPARTPTKGRKKAA